MYELIFTVCSFVQGVQCRELPSIAIEQGGTPYACVMASQIEGAKWIDDHPNFYINRMTCQPAGVYSKA